MTREYYNAMATAVTVEQPIDGQTGVWLKSGGATVISSGMKMTGATVSTGQVQYIYDRGAASGTLATGGGLIIATSGAVIRNASASEYANAFAVSATGAAVSGLNVWNASAMLSNCTAENIVIGTDIGTYTARVNAWGGNVSSVNMGTKTMFSLSRYVSVSEVYVSSGAYLGADGSSYIDELVALGGGIVSAYQTTINHLIMSGGRPTLTAHAVLNSLTTTERGGTITVTGGSAMDGRTVSQVAVVLYSGVTCSALTVGNAAACHVYNAAILSAPVLLSGASLYVASGGSALAVTSNAGAVVTVAAGGYIEYA